MQENSNIDTMRFVETFDKLARTERRKQSLFGLKQSEVRVLLCIKQLFYDNKQNITVSEISKKLFVTSPTVTELIKSLSNNGYIERNVDSQDKRVSDIKLTAKGEKKVEKLINYFTSLFSGLIERIGVEQSEKLLDLLDEVCNYLNETNLEIE
ncbi:MarR family winged helix-turn-helix transcriptional regulator [Ruminiclostridium josui]|uniref:MarR family winged helix-turn-helix transcriptional regulator n=1 Tax=Ruminiclostridium josui TaxID=1499 RepID=UPI0004655174|nr:MarR family transcriptional regulator [Ruminiclostridium josui]